MICESCGRIVDTGSLNLEAIVAALHRETGFDIRGSRLDFFGTCPSCRCAGRA